MEYRENAEQYTSFLHPANPEDMYTMQECKCGKATVFRNIRQLANVAFTILLLLRKFISNFICYPSLDVRCNQLITGERFLWVILVFQTFCLLWFGELILNFPCSYIMRSYRSSLSIIQIDQKMKKIILRNFSKPFQDIRRQMGHVLLMQYSENACFR